MEPNNTDIVKKIEAAKIEPADINAIKTNQGLYEFVDGDLNLLEEVMNSHRLMFSLQRF